MTELLTEQEIENRRKFLRGITKPDTWVDKLCDMALASLREGEPVAWRWRRRKDGDLIWHDWHVVGYKPQGPESHQFQFEPLFAHPPTAQWVSVKERLPDKSVTWCWTSDGLNSFPAIWDWYSKSFDPSGPWCIDDMYEVTHWMPLPPSPEKQP